MILNTVNNKKYIGKSKNLKQRWGDHKKVANGGKEKYPKEYFAIHAAINKYGIDNFKFVPIEVFETEEEAYTAECFWIDLLNTYNKNYGYNCTLGGDGVRAIGETLEKIIANNNSDTVRESRRFHGKKRHLENPNYFKNLAIGNKSNLGKNLPQEQKDKISDTLKNKYENDTEYANKINSNASKLLKFGEEHARSKLTEKQVLEIRSKYIPRKYGYIKLAKEYNVNDETIRSIVLRKTWTHI